MNVVLFNVLCMPQLVTRVDVIFIMYLSYRSQYCFYFPYIHSLARQLIMFQTFNFALMAVLHCKYKLYVSINISIKIMIYVMLWLICIRTIVSSLVAIWSWSRFSCIYQQTEYTAYVSHRYTGSYTLTPPENG